MNKKRKNKQLKASMTVEAAFVIPICFYTFLVFLYLFVYVHTQFLIYQAMICASDKIYSYGTVTAYLENSGLLVDAFDLAGGVLPDEIDDFIDSFDDTLFSKAAGEYVQAEIKNYFIDNNIKLSCVKDEEDGFDCSSSSIFGGNGNIYIRVKYTLEFPLSFFGIGKKDVVQQLHLYGFYGEKWKETKEFDGEINKDSDSDTEDKEYVYVATNATVYHISSSCTYLSRNIKKTSMDEIGNLRNSSGAKYYACEYCGSDAKEMVYYTEYGTRYHSSDSCSSLERNATKITLDEATQRGLRVCSKCGSK